MRTIIAGSRTASRVQTIAAIELCGWVPSEIISGGARGADAYGEEYARANMIRLTTFAANWDAHGKAAGPIRNRQMAANADALIAVWDGSSKGTKNMIDEATARRLKVFVFNYGATP